MSSQSNVNLLKVLNPLPSFGKKKENAQLTAKDKRYAQLIEKAVLSFDSVIEWADYISFLSRLQKALASHTSDWVPQSFDIAKRLAFCLASNLPSGVHRKTLELYDLLFNILGLNTLNKEVSIWIPGLLPLMSYASISIKPQLIKLFEDHILKLDPRQLGILSKALLLSLLPGLDDETSESFQQTLDLVEKFKQNLDNDSHFWQCLFLVVITNPDKRLGALVWCNRKLPSFSKTKNISIYEDDLKTKEKSLKALKEEAVSSLIPEAQECVSPESGIMIRAFCKSLADENLFVQRGFFDLLLSRIELNSDVIQILTDPKDKELLIMSACRAVLRKDMSLNRRLWNWLLGPENENTSITADSNQNIDSKSKSFEEKLTRTQYFETYGSKSLTSGLLKLIKGQFDSDPTEKQKIESFKIALSILDRWEIGQLIIPQILVPILDSCYKSPDSKEVLKSAMSFFDGVEAISIWSDILQLILTDKNLNLVEFILKNFNIEDEEMIITHLPLALLSLLLTNHSFEMSSQWLEIVKILIDFIPERAYLPIEHSSDLFLEACSTNELKDNLSKEILENITNYYVQNTKGESVPNPYAPADLALITLQSINILVIESLKNEHDSYTLCETLTLVLNKVPHSDKVWRNETLIQTVLSLPAEVNLETAFSISKIFHHLINATTTIEKGKILKIVLSNLWRILIDPFAKFQVEAVKSIIDLEMSVESHYIEAGLSYLFLNSNRNDRLRAFNTLWTHSSSYNESDSFLVRPLQLLLDNLDSTENLDYIGISNFVQSSMNSGSNNRLLKMVSFPLLSNNFITNSQLSLSDDLKLFNYQLSTISNLLKVDKKLISDTFNSELVVIDNSTQLGLVKENNWDISTYKSLITLVISKFISLKIPSDYDSSFLEIYSSSVRLSLGLLELLMNGHETNFKAIFLNLVDSCSSFSELKDSFQELDLIEINYLRTISAFLRIAENTKADLVLLHDAEEKVEPYFVKFITDGISNANSSILLKEWTRLLLKSLYIFEDSMFGVILSINDNLTHKVDSLFEEILKDPSTNTKITNLDTDQSLSVLMTGLEDVLSIVHSYLLTREARASSYAKNANDPGFFGTVIQGVFQVESPMARSAQENKRLTVLLCFQDAVVSCFKIWLWAEERTKITLLDDFATTSQDLNFDKTTNFMATKFKFRSKKLLESLFNLEPIEVLETLINYEQTPLLFKLLNILDGGRPQLTIPYILDSLISRIYPQLIDTKRQSMMNIDISGKRLSSFLVDYIVSIDDDSIEDIWTLLTQFFRDASSHTSSFKFIFPDILKFMNNLAIKLTRSKFGEQKRIKKELSEYFIKFLYPTLAAKTPDKLLGSLLTLVDDSAGSHNNKTDEDLPGTLADSKNSSTSITQEEVVDSIDYLLPNLALLLQDSDKTSTVISSVIINLITPSFKSKKTKEYPISLVKLLDSIGERFQIKLWKTTIYDSLMDPVFFQVSFEKAVPTWNSIMTKWIASDKDRFIELSNRIQPYSTNSTLFSWNDSEIESRALHIKRVAYLLMIQPKDYFLNNLEELFARILDSLNNSNSKILKVDLLLLLRCIVLKFSELHLLSYWVAIYSELQSIFYNVLECEDPKKLESSDLGVIIAGAKLLDVLLVVGFDEFKLNEWLFVTDNTDSIYRISDVPILALIDRISIMNESNFVKDDSIKIQTDREVPGDASMKLKPLLVGIKSISTVGNLKSFFDSLSLNNFERNYGLNPPDIDACEQDIFDDLFNSI